MKLKTYLLASAVCVLPIAASASDLAVKAPVRVAAVAPFTWTGFYVGGTAGLISQDSVHTDIGDGTFGFISAIGDTYGVPGHGSLFGFNAGYNHQMGSWVFGIEADISAANLDNTMYASPWGGGSCRWGFQSKLSSLTTVRGRIGYAFERALLYATGGWAYGNVKNEAATAGRQNGEVFSQSGTKSGWVGGAGLEYAIDNHWTVRAEALHVDLGTSTSAVNPCGCRFSFKNTYNIGRLGLNYKF